MNKRAVGTALIVASAFALIMYLPVAGPANDGAMSYKFAVGGDDHYGSTVAPGVNEWGNASIAYMSALQKNGVQRFFEVGDLTMELGLLAYRELADIYNSSRIPYNITLGNHDCGYLPSDCQHIFDYYGGPYVLAVDSIVFILMEATTMTAFNESTISWLGSTLTAHQNEICFVMMHIMHNKLGYPEVEVSDAAFTNLVETHANHIGAIIAGHIHEYNSPHMYYINGVRYTYSGTVGEGYVLMNPEGIYSYLTVEMDKTTEGWNIHLYRKNIDTDTVIAGTEEYYTVEWGDLAVEGLPTFSVGSEFGSGIGAASFLVATMAILTGLRQVSLRNTP
jgi:hypothetical protein